MIQKQRQLFYFVGDQPFKTLREAQLADLAALIPDTSIPGKEHLAEWMLENATAIVDCLTTTPTSRARARKTNGGTKRRTPRLQPAVIKEP